LVIGKYLKTPNNLFFNDLAKNLICLNGKFYCKVLNYLELLVNILNLTTVIKLLLSFIVNLTAFTKQKPLFLKF